MPKAAKTKDGKDKVPRPQNQFMIYRQEKTAEYNQRHPPGIPRMIQSELSKHIAEQWRSEADTIRAQYKARADAAKAEHKRLHPDYVYKPEKVEDKKARQTATKEAVALERAARREAAEAARLLRIVAPSTENPFGKPKAEPGPTFLPLASTSGQPSRDGADDQMIQIYGAEGPSPPMSLASTPKSTHSDLPSPPSSAEAHFLPTPEEAHCPPTPVETTRSSSTAPVWAPSTSDSPPDTLDPDGGVYPPDAAGFFSSTSVPADHLTALLASYANPGPSTDPRPIPAGTGDVAQGMDGSAAMQFPSWPLSGELPDSGPIDLSAFTFDAHNFALALDGPAGDAFSHFPPDAFAPGAPALTGPIDATLGTMAPLPDFGDLGMLPPDMPLLDVFGADQGGWPEVVFAPSDMQAFAAAAAAADGFAADPFAMPQAGATGAGSLHDPPMFTYNDAASYALMQPAPALAPLFAQASDMSAYLSQDPPHSSYSVEPSPPPSSPPPQDESPAPPPPYAPPPGAARAEQRKVAGSWLRASAHVPR